MDDIKPRRSPGISRERAQFQSSYYYSPTRPARGFITNRDNLRTTPTGAEPQTTPPAPHAPIRRMGADKSSSVAPQHHNITTRPAAATHRTVVPAHAHHASPVSHTRVQSAARPPKRRRVSPAFVLLTLLVGAGYLGVRTFNKGAETQPQASNAQPAATQAATVAALEQPAETSTKAEMESVITETIAANKNINTSVTITDITTGETVSYGVDAAFDAASTGKVLSAVQLLNQIEDGKVKTDEQLGGQAIPTLIKNMIELSDNAAWGIINTKLTHAAMQEYARSTVGMSTYTANGNLMKTRDMATLLTQLYTGKLLDETNKKTLLDHMKNANKTEYILSTIPDGITVYHKAGWNTDRSHDAAIIDNGKRPYVLVIYTKGVDGTDTDQRISIIRKITGATTAHFISRTTAAKAE